MSGECMKMPKKVGRHRFLSHIQGIAHTPDGLVFSRNAKEHAELIYPRRGKVKKFKYQHAGGIDCAGDTIAVPLYDKEAKYGHLAFVTGAGTTAFHRTMDSKPYAVAIEWMGGNFLICCVTKPDGSRLEWYEVSIFKRDGKTCYGDLNHLDTHAIDPAKGARNNICMRRLGGALYLYTFRSHLGYGTVTKHLVRTCQTGVITTDEMGHYTRRNLPGLAAMRFGATVRHYGTQGGVEILLYRTARNIYFDKLYVRKDKIDWRYDDGTDRAED